jgi:hypothetical protein
MYPTNTDLEAVFQHSKLPSLGYTFQSAITCDAIKTCLVRIALNTQKQAAIAPPKQYWWHNI